MHLDVLPQLLTVVGQGLSVPLHDIVCLISLFYLSDDSMNFVPLCFLLSVRSSRPCFAMTSLLGDLRPALRLPFVIMSVYQIHVFSRYWTWNFVGISYHGSFFFSAMLHDPYASRMSLLSIYFTMVSESLLARVAKGSLVMKSPCPTENVRSLRTYLS